MSEYTDSIIESMWKEIKADIEHGKLFGEPIDMTDIRQVAIAAHLRSEMLTEAKYRESIETLENLVRPIAVHSNKFLPSWAARNSYVNYRPPRNTDTSGN